MNFFSDIPGFDEELVRAGEKALELTRDSLCRQPLTEVLDAVFSAPGKMLRPALVLAFGRFGENYPDCADPLTDTAAVVELIHMASLIHDDIVDDAPTRRGRPVAAPYSPPAARSASASAPDISTVKGPSPTQVE